MFHNGLNLKYLFPKLNLYRVTEAGKVQNYRFLADLILDFDKKSWDGEFILKEISIHQKNF